MNFKDQLAGDGLDAVTADLLPTGVYKVKVIEICKTRYNNQERYFRAQIIEPVAYAGREFSKTYDLSRTAHKLALKSLYDALPDAGDVVLMEISHFNSAPYPVRFSSADGGTK